MYPRKRPTIEKVNFRKWLSKMEVEHAKRTITEEWTRKWILSTPQTCQRISMVRFSRNVTFRPTNEEAEEIMNYLVAKYGCTE